MTSQFFYQNTDLGTRRVRLGSIANITTNAERGAVATSSIELDDEAGDLDLPPFFGFLAYENAATQPLWYIGYGSVRTAQRADSLVSGAQRRVSLQVEDLNAQLSFRVVNHNTPGYRRPAEDDYHRIDWLLGGLLSSVEDNGLIDRDGATNVEMSPVDYTGQTPDQVLQDCSDLSGKNYFLYADPATGNRSLAYFKSDDASFFPSGCFISNDLADLGNADTYQPQKEPILTQDPETVFNGAMMDYSGGTIYLQHGTDLPLIRDTVIASANTSSKTHATALVQKYLESASFEKETVAVTIAVPPENVNDILAGMLVTATFLQFPGWDNLAVRVLNRSISTEMTKGRYNIALTLGHPKLVSFAPGQVPDNTTVWPSDLPPFEPGAGGGTPTYVQSAKHKVTAGNATETVTLGAAPMAGNFLGIFIGQVQSASVNTYTLPDGWEVDDIYVPPGSDAPALDCQMILASKISDGTETSVVVDNPSLSQAWEIFYFEYSGATGYGGFAHGQQAASSTFTLPSVTPTPGRPTAVLAFLNWDPDYVVVSPLANTRQTEDRGAWSARASLSYSDTIIASASGSYDGTTSGSVGSETGYGAIVTWLTGDDPAEPVIGQVVAPESAISNGSRTVYTTNYPYVPGSLVVKVNGVTVANVAETSPSTGVFTLPYPPAPRALITWTYNVADPTPTGANNPPPPSSVPAVPGDPGSMPGGDGTSRPPDHEYTPAETPDGVITVFTIVPYVPGQTFVYINGLIQRRDIDWSELDPAAGTFEFTTAPWTGAAITVKAMPVTAPASGSGFGNPSLYGSGINADTKANIQNNANAVSHRFRSIGGVLSTVRWQQRGGAVYSGGTGGTYDITVEADVGGSPSGTPLATESYTPGNPGGDWTTYDQVTFSPTVTLTADTLYHIVFTNTDGAPNTNYVSVNELFMYGSSPIPPGQGRQPLFDDDDWAVLVDDGGWSVQSRYTADMDLGYVSGSHQGMGYIQNMTAQYGTLSGTANMVRELFTVSGGDRTVVSCAVRVRRSSGTSDLVLGLYTGAGSLIEAVNIPAALIPISAAGGDNGGSVWAGARFLASHVLTNGQTYYLRLSCASGTTYTAAPIRKGTTEGMDGDTVFMDGEGQFTTNSGGTWTDLYTFDTDPPDLQFQMGVST